MKNNTPFLFSMFIMMILSTILSLSSTNFLTVWIMLELNMLSFIPIMKNNKWNQETEASTKYFLAQALGSLFLLLSSSLQQFTNSMFLFYSTILTTSLLLKLGAAPCHMWYPSVMAAMSWTNCLILSTWQKLAPLMLLLLVNNLNKMNSTLMMIACINTMVGGIMGMNQTHLRPLLAYSSIGHIGWMLSMISINNQMTALAYFSMYSILAAPVFLYLNYANSMTIKDINSMTKSNMFMSPMLSILMMSLAGLPPLTGIIPKLMVIFSMTSTTTNYLIIFILLLGSYMNLYYYLNISLSSILSSTTNNNIQVKPMSASILMSLLTTTSMSMIGLVFIL